MRLDLFWSMGINSESEPMLCGIPLSGPDYFCWGWGEVVEIFNFEGVFSWILTLSCSFEYVLVNLYI